MQDINRPHTPDKATADFIYEAYMLLRRAPESFGTWARQGAMENIAACSVSWRPIAISEDALRRIGATRSNKGCARGHWYDRKQRHKDLFGPAALEPEVLMKHFYDHDTTVLITKEQNDARGAYSTWGRIVPVPELPDEATRSGRQPERNVLFPTSGYTFAVRKTVELPWVDARIAELDQTR